MPDKVDYDNSDGMQVFTRFWDNVKEKQIQKNNEYLRSYQHYCSYIDMKGRDPYRSNLYIPKVFSTVETIVPRLCKALFNSRPYIP